MRNPTNTPRVFHVETMWKRSFPRRGVFAGNMQVNSDLNRQVREVTFSRKFPRPNHREVNLNNTLVFGDFFEENHGTCLNEKLNFCYQLKKKLAKVTEAVNAIRKHRDVLPKHHAS